MKAQTAPEFPEGSPEGAVPRSVLVAGTAARKLWLALTVTLVSIVAWFVVGVLINVSERLALDDEQIVSGTFTVGNVEVNAAVFVTMLIWTGLLLFTWIRSLVVVWRGGTFKEALDVALWR